MKAEPKHKFIEETKSLTADSRHQAESKAIEVCGETIVVYPQVFDPGIFFSTCWFADTVATYLAQREPETFCEVGCGTGLLSLIVQKRLPGRQVRAGDINPAAVQNARENMARHDLSETVLITQSDVFSGFTAERFDAIFWALPFGYLDENAEADIVDLQTFDPGYRAIETFFKEGKDYLNEGGELLFGFSPELGHMELIEAFADRYEWKLEMIGEKRDREVSDITMQVYAARPSFV